jgi:putative acetyltransferase
VGEAVNCLEHQTGNEKRKKSSLPVQIRPMQSSSDATAFRVLNEEWISQHFAIEQKDLETLVDPQTSIVNEGGQIFVACVQDEVVGCVALIPLNKGMIELAKMTVATKWRGFGIGRRLLQYSIEQARDSGATVLFLASNAKLGAAIHLYEAVGFKHVPAEQLPPMPYERANVFMRLEL